MAQPAPTFREMTRATNFQKKFQLPPNFSDVLKDFTREVLRDQPTEIYGFATEYFKRLALEAEGLQPVPPKGGARGRQPLSPAEREQVGALRTRLLDAFHEEDLDNNPRLHAHIIKRVLTSTTGLSPDQALYLVSNVHNNLHLLDGSIEYERFVTDLILYIHFFITTNHVFPRPKSSVHGLTREELHPQLMSALQSADRTGTGRLLLAEYHACLERLPLQLTRRDITLLAVEAVVAGDNYINIADEVERAFPLLQASAVYDAFQEDWDEGRV